MLEDRSMDLLLATIEHRLEQFTTPSFERGTVERLVKEIWRLRHEGSDSDLAVQLAAAHNEIDELNEQNAGALRLAKVFQERAIYAEAEAQVLRDFLKAPKMLAPGPLPDGPSEMKGAELRRITGIDALPAQDYDAGSIGSGLNPNFDAVRLADGRLLTATEALQAAGTLNAAAKAAELAQARISKLFAGAGPGVFHDAPEAD